MKVAITILYVVVAILYVALASFANVCLIGRDDRNLEIAALLRRSTRESRKDSRTKRRAHTSNSNSNNSSMPSITNLHAQIGEPPSSPTSIRSSSRSCSSSRANSDDDECEGYDAAYSSPSGASSYLDVRSMIGEDVRCWFFILVIVSSCVQAIMWCILLLRGNEHEMQLRGDRNIQDEIVAPGILLFYVTFTSLLLILIHLVEKEVGQVELSGGDVTVTWRVSVTSILCLIALIIPCFILAATNVWDDALEVYSNVVEFALCLAYAVAAVVLPRRVESFGQGLQSVARKIRYVCLVVSVSMIVRGIPLLPPVQTSMGALGDYALPILESTTMIPVLLSLLLLHQPSK